MKKGVFIIGALVLSIGAVCLKAATPGEIELTKDIIEVERKAIVAINMQLDEETAKTFWPLYNDYQNSLKKVKDQKVELLQSYAQDWRDLPEEKASEGVSPLAMINTGTSLWALVMENPFFDWIMLFYFPSLG